MHDPLLCDPAEKAELEADNGVKQIEYIDHLVSERRVEHIAGSSHVAATSGYIAICFDVLALKPAARLMDAWKSFTRDRS